MSAGTSRTSVIRHRANDTFLMLRTGYIDICKESPDANVTAMLLHVFENWSNWKRNNRSQSEARNQRDVEAGGNPTQDTTDWIWKSYGDLQEDIFGLAGINKIGQCVNWLVDVEYLERRSNPEHAWDKTPQYRLNASAVQAALDTGLNSASVNTEGIDDLKLKHRQSESKPAIPKNTSESTKNSRVEDARDETDQDTVPELEPYSATKSRAWDIITFELHNIPHIVKEWFEMDCEEWGEDHVLETILERRTYGTTHYSAIRQHLGRKAQQDNPNPEHMAALLTVFEIDATNTTDTELNTYKQAAAELARANVSPDEIHDLHRYMKRVGKDWSSWGIGAMLKRVGAWRKDQEQRQRANHTPQAAHADGIEYIQFDAPPPPNPDDSAIQQVGD